MRQYFRGLLGLMVLAGMPACVDLDEVLVSGVSSQFFASPQGVEAAVNATYSHLRLMYQDERPAGMGEFGTDIWTHGDQGGKKHFNRYDPALNPSDNWFSGTWNPVYRGINTANTLLDRVDDVTGMNPATKTIRIAEVRFLRALFYFHLVQNFGDIPLLLTESQGIITEMTRTPASQVYDAIIADLQAAVADLPATQSDYGRATKAAAQHLLGKVHLTRAYKPYAAANDFATAASLLETVITTSGRSLRPQYRQVFDINNQRHSEVIFSVQNSYDTQLRGPEGGNRLHLYYLSFYDDRPGLARSILHGRAFRRKRPTQFAINLWDKTMDTRYHDSFQHVWLATNAAAQGAVGTSRGPIAIGDTALVLTEFEVTPAYRQSKAYTIYAPSQWDEFRFPSLDKHKDPLRPSVNEEHGGREMMVMRLAETYLLAAEARLGAGSPGMGIDSSDSRRRQPSHQSHSPPISIFTTIILC